VLSVRATRSFKTRTSVSHFNAHPSRKAGLDGQEATGRMGTVTHRLGLQRHFGRCLGSTKVATALFMMFIPVDVVYRGYRIVWDTRQVSGTGFWTGKVAVVLPPDESRVTRVRRISDGIYAVSEEAARDCFIGMAKEWIDATIGKESGSAADAMPLCAAAAQPLARQYVTSRKVP
jgi:hypothetical protein